MHELYGIAGRVEMRAGEYPGRRGAARSEGISQQSMMMLGSPSPITLPPVFREGLYAREIGRPAGFCEAKLCRVGDLSDVRVE